MTNKHKLHVPSSKSLTQRALIVTALARGESTIYDPLDCDDSRFLRNALRKMGVTIEEQPRVWRVSSHRPRTPEESLWCGDAGTTLRFLTPLSLVIDGEMQLDGSPRLRERPISKQLSALRQLGVTTRYLGIPDSLPLVLNHEGPIGSIASVDGIHSSQFASGLLMVAPCLPQGLTLTLAGGPPISRPYLDLTLDIMKAMGVHVEEEENVFKVPRREYLPGAVQVEGDWSSAAFLLAASWITGLEIDLPNISTSSRQGDRVIVDFLSQLSSSLDAHRFDLTHCPDLIAPLAAACALAKTQSEIRGVAHARVKESDRVSVLAEGFQRAGVKLKELPDGLVFEPNSHLVPEKLDPHNDHRMAMAFALLSLKEPGIQVQNPECVGKSYPSFWQDLEQIRALIEK